MLSLTHFIWNTKRNPYKLYNCFYMFQSTLLQAFSKEILTTEFQNYFKYDASRKEKDLNILPRQSVIYFVFPHWFYNQNRIELICVFYRCVW
jgi:hypothetical protein